MQDNQKFTKEELDNLISVAENLDYDAFKQHTAKMNPVKLEGMVNAAAIGLAQLKSDRMDKIVGFLLQSHLIIIDDRCPYALEDLAGKIYAKAGRTDKFEKVLESGGVLGAIYAYAYTGMIDEVNLLIGCIFKREYEKPDIARLKRLEAEAGYYACGFFADDDKLLRLLSVTRDADFRQQLAMSPFIEKRANDVECDREALLEKATVIHGYMKSYKLDYDQALVLYPEMQKVKRIYPDGIVASVFAGTLFCDVQDKVAAESNAVENARNSTTPRNDLAP